MRFTAPFILALCLSSPAYAIHDQIGEYQNLEDYNPLTGKYQNLEDITTDPYQEANEGLHPEYLAKPTLPNIKPLECGIERETPESTFMQTFHQQNGLAVHAYDLNGDGKRDAEISIPIGDENPYPLFYFFDRDYDGQPDIGYRDSLRDGSCRGIVVHWVPSMEDLASEPFDPKGEL